MGGKSNITTSSDTATTDATNKNSMVDKGKYIFIFNTMMIRNTAGVAFIPCRNIPHKSLV